jgi:hypothetical protein
MLAAAVVVAARLPDWQRHDTPAMQYHRRSRQALTRRQDAEAAIDDTLMAPGAKGRMLVVKP